MFTEEQISSLVLRVQEARASGRACKVEDLCGQTPELVAEVKRRLAHLDHMGALCEVETSTLGVVRMTEPQETSPALPRSDAGIEGTRLGRYRLLRQLGKGGMGEVYEAEDERLHRRVAVKVMQAEVALVPANRERFLREGRRQASLESDHIVPIHDSGEDSGVPFLVMPLLHGESLEERLKREPRLPLGLALQVGWQTAEGLAVAHERGLIHRDVKPANVWLDGEKPGNVQRARLLDFGLARSVALVDAVTQAGLVVGTPGYLAPEQMDDEPGDARADLFSLGVMLYRMTTGQMPFHGSSVLALARALAAGEPPAPEFANPAVPKPLSELILRLLARDPEERPASAREVASQLRTIEQSLTTAALSAPGLLQGTPSSARSRMPGKPNDAGQASAQDQKPPWTWQRRFFLVALPAGLAAVLLVGLWSLGNSWLQPPAGPGPQPPAVSETPLDGKLLVRVRTKDGRKRGALIGVDPLALPVREDELLQLEAELNQSAYIYLLWIDGKGVVTPLYPWNPEGKLVHRTLAAPPPKQHPQRTVRSPDHLSDWWPADDTEGLDTMLLLARREPLPGNVSLAELVGKLPEAKLGPLHEVVVRGMDRGNLVGEIKVDQDRSPKEKVTVDDQLLNLMDRLKGHFELIRAVQFAHAKK